MLLNKYNNINILISNININISIQFILIF